MKHTTRVNVVRFSHDGTRMYSADGEGTIIVWTVARGAAAGGGDYSPTSFTPFCTVIHPQLEGNSITSLCLRPHTQHVLVMAHGVSHARRAPLQRQPGALACTRVPLTAPPCDALPVRRFLVPERVPHAQLCVEARDTQPPSNAHRLQSSVRHRVLRWRHRHQLACARVHVTGRRVRALPDALAWSFVCVRTRVCDSPDSVLCMLWWRCSHSYVLAGSEDGEACLWNAQTQRRVTTPGLLVGFDTMCLPVAWHPKQHLFAVAAFGTCAWALLAGSCWWDRGRRGLESDGCLCAWLACASGVNRPILLYANESTVEVPRPSNKLKKSRRRLRSSASSKKLAAALAGAAKL